MKQFLKRIDAGRYFPKQNRKASNQERESHIQHLHTLEHKGYRRASYENIDADVSKESGNRFRTAVAPRRDFEGSETSHPDIFFHYVILYAFNCTVIQT